MKKIFVLTFLLFVKPSFTFIDGIFHILLKNQKKITLYSDAYQGYPKDWNQYSVPDLILSIKDYAKENSDEKILFSYEDPSIYCLQENLLEVFQEFGEKFIRLSNKYFTSFIRLNVTGELLPLKIFGNDKFSSFLNGDLTYGLSVLVNEGEWPKNLKIKSNDPRLEYLMGINEEILGKFNKRIFLEDVLFVEQNFFKRLDKFSLSNDIPKENLNPFYKILNDFDDAYLQEIKMFQIYMQERNVDLKINDFKKTLNRLAGKVSFDHVASFLKKRKQMGDIFSMTPILDVLLSVLDKNAFDHTIVILGRGNAQNFINILKDMDVVLEIRKI